MKRLFLSSLAVALMGAASFVLSAKTSSAAQTSAEPVRLRIDVDRTILGADIREKAVVKIALDCVQLPRRDLRPPVNLALVIDRSGSMSGDKIVKAREAALEAVRRLSRDDVVSLVVYDTNVQTLVSAQRVGDGRRLENAICGIEVGGSTNLHGGIVQGAAEVRRHMEDRRFINRIVLLSDGLANVGPKSPEELGRLGASLRKEGISVTTIGLGLGFNEDLMARLAQRSDGNTYFVEHSNDLPRIFAAELGDVLNVVARGVTIEIDFPNGVRPLNFVGRDGVIRGQRAELTLNQLYGGQEKFALVEVEVSPTRPGVEIEIARARVSFEDAVNQKAATLTAKRNVQFSSNRTAMVNSADHRVQADWAANVIAVAKEEAIVLNDANRRDDAARGLRERSQMLESVAKTYHNPSVGSLAASNYVEADRLEREGLDNAGRKNYRADSAQTVNQQAVPASSSK